MGKTLVSGSGSVVVGNKNTVMSKKNIVALEETNKQLALEVERMKKQLARAAASDARWEMTGILFSPDLSRFSNPSKAPLYNGYATIKAVKYIVAAWRTQREGQVRLQFESETDAEFRRTSHENEFIKSESEVANAVTEGNTASIHRSASAEVRKVASIARNATRD